jgi:hypothetical protein
MVDYENSEEMQLWKGAFNETVKRRFGIFDNQFKDTKKFKGR